MSILPKNFWCKITAVASKYEERFSRAYQGVLEGARSKLKSRDIPEETFSSPEKLENLIDWDYITRESNARFQPIYIEIFQEAGNLTSYELQCSKIAQNTASKWAQQHSARLVRSVTEESREAIRNVVSEGISYDLPNKIKLQRIMSVIGLDKRRAISLENYRKGLVESGVKPSKIKTMVEKQRVKLLKDRAKVISQTETTYAKTQGFYRATVIAKKEGRLKDTAQLVWISALSERTCPTCGKLHGQTAPIGGRFSDGSMGPPKHPRCWCSLSITD